MNDLISKHEIISEFENDLLCMKFGSALKGTFRGSIDISDVIERIKEFPTVDAVEVVRCKDCEQFRWNEGLSDNLTGFCFEHDMTVLGVDFCSYGERKEATE